MFTETGSRRVVARRRISPTVDVVRRPRATLYRNQAARRREAHRAASACRPPPPKPLGEHTGVGLPATRCVRHLTERARRRALPTFVHVTVHRHLALRSPGSVQLTVLVMSAPADVPFTGTVVSSRCCWSVRCSRWSSPVP